MQSAADGLREVLGAASFNDPAVPVVSNVTALSMTAAAGFADELAEQVTSPVRWLDRVHTMQAGGVSRVIEFGPGRVLSGLLRRIDRSIELSNIGTVEDLDGNGGE